MDFKNGGSVSPTKLVGGSTRSDHSGIGVTVASVWSGLNGCVTHGKTVDVNPYKLKSAAELTGYPAAWETARGRKRGSFFSKMRQTAL